MMFVLITLFRFGEVALGEKYTEKILQYPPSPIFERDRKGRKYGKAVPSVFSFLIR